MNKKTKSLYERMKNIGTKGLIYAMTMATSLAACDNKSASKTEETESATTENAMTDSIEFVPSTKTSVIKQKRQEMLALSDTASYFYFSDDTELNAQDPHAYWLMNRMMQMVQLVKTADDGWAWMLAMNKSVEEYNSRLGRKIGSPELAMSAIAELIDIYNAGNQAEINTASYVLMIIAHYKTLLEYSDLLQFTGNKDNEDLLRDLYYREYSEWFDFNNAINGLMCFYTYAAAHYSALPMDLNGTFEYWSNERLKEMKIEKDIFWSYQSTPFKSEAEYVSAQKFDALIDYFKSRTQQTAIKEITSDMGEKDDEFATEITDGRYDFDTVAKMLGYIETAINNWRDVRKQITRTLPPRKQDSYREITKQTHTRFYNDLLGLKRVRY